MFGTCATFALMKPEPRMRCKSFVQAAIGIASNKQTIIGEHSKNPSCSSLAVITAVSCGCRDTLANEVAIKGLQHQVARLHLFPATLSYTMHQATFTRRS